MNGYAPVVVQASCVAINGRALMIEGAPGSGKSSLALALIDRGAGLIGDDAVGLMRTGDQVIAHPPPHIAGLIELRGIGLFTLALAPPAPLALILTLGGAGLASDHERLPETLAHREIAGVMIPVLPFVPGALAAAVRAEWALARHGLASKPPDPA
ncbi:MAG: HPr kinase/phosphorylase [Erythrobacter sp.]